MKATIKTDREYRKFINFELRAAKIEDNNELYVEGYAATFNSPTVLYEYDGVEYKEQIDDRAFDEADMADVIFNYNHQGKVMARTRNKTLQLSTDKKGLMIKARVDGTEEGRRIYQEIRDGYIDRMSYSYSVKESAYDFENHTRTVRKIKRLYDVSAVDIPAYDDTSISARSYFEQECEKEKALVSAELRKRLIIESLL
jgi:hypothetical protein